MVLFQTFFRTICFCFHCGLKPLASLWLNFNIFLVPILNVAYAILNVANIQSLNGVLYLVKDLLL